MKMDPLSNIQPDDLSSAKEEIPEMIPGGDSLENAQDEQQPWDQVHHLFEQSPAAVMILKGPDLVVELANIKALEIIGRTTEETLGNKLGEVLPELEMQNYLALMLKVYQSGDRFVAEESPVTFKRKGIRTDTFVKFVFQPLKDKTGNVNGLMITGDDIGEQVLARKKIEESEERFRTMANEAPLFVWMVDENLQTTFLNKTGRDFFNLEDSIDITHFSWKGFIHPDDIDRVISVMQDAAAKKQPYTMEIRLKNGDGKYHWFLDKGTPRYADQRLIGFIGTSLNIHDRKEAEEKIQQSEKDLEEKVKEKTIELKNQQSFLRQVIDSSVEFVAVLNTELRIITVNKKFEDYMHVKREDIRGLSLFDINPKARDSEPHAAMLRALEGETVYMSKLRGIALPNIFLDTYFVPLILQYKIEGVIIMSRDVTDIVKSEILLAQKNNELERSNKELESFNYIASHDLQEPLRKIQTFIDLVQRKSDGSNTEKYLGKIRESTQRMSQLIKSLLEYSRLSQKNEIFHDVDLNEILETVKSDYELRISEINAVIESDHLPVIRANPLQMHQLFANLVSNSLKFSDKTPLIQITSKIIDAGKIKFNVKPGEQYVEIKFIDNGIGFDLQYKEQIFKLFQRLHSRDDYNGTGVGLSIVKKIIDQHQGFIRADSVLGQGSVLTLWLPVSIEL